MSWKDKKWNGKGAALAARRLQCLAESNAGISAGVKTKIMNILTDLTGQTTGRGLDVCVCNKDPLMTQSGLTQKNISSVHLRSGLKTDRFTAPPVSTGMSADVISLSLI